MSVIPVKEGMRALSIMAIYWEASRSVVDGVTCVARWFSGVNMQKKEELEREFMEARKMHQALEVEIAKVMQRQPFRYGEGPG